MTDQLPVKVTSILSGVLVGSAAMVSGVPSAEAGPSDPTRATVVYELSGAGVAGYVTYATDSGQQHATGATLPWSMQVTRLSDIPGYSAANTLSAQTAGPGSLTCAIKIDGKVVSQNTATGDPARVSCEDHQGRGEFNPHPWLDHKPFEQGS